MQNHHFQNVYKSFFLRTCLPAMLIVCLLGVTANSRSMDVNNGSSVKVLAEDETVAVMLGDKFYPTVSPEVANRSNVFRRRIFDLGNNAYAALGYSGSSVMVVGDSGAIVAGTVVFREDADLIEKHFAPLRKGRPVLAVIYNDSIADNYGGVEAFVSKQDVERNKVSIIAHENFMEQLTQVSDVERAISQRTLFSSGGFLPRGVEGYLHMGAVALKNKGTVTFFTPNFSIQDSWKGNIGGVDMEIYHVPAESVDGIITYFPAQKLLVVGHAVIGDFLPQVYTPRGIVRDSKRWYKGLEFVINFVRSHEVETMIPTHFFEPIKSKNTILDILITNRDALQFMTDQSARLINKGYTPDDLATLTLPPHLTNHPAMAAHYGTLNQHIRQRFYDQLGWFEGDPTFIDPDTKKVRAKKYIKLFGGRSAVISEATQAFEVKDYLWTAELMTWLIALDVQDSNARQLKANALRQLGYKAENAYHRNLYLTSALELENKLPNELVIAPTSIPKAAMDSLTPIELVDIFKPRFIAEKTFNTERIININLTDFPEVIALHIRHGVLVTHGYKIEDASTEITMTLETLRSLVTGQLTFGEALGDGAIEINAGKREDVSSLDDLLDPIAGSALPVALPVF